MEALRWTHTAFVQRLHFGLDAVDTVADVVKEVGARRAMLISTPARLESEGGRRLLRRLGRAVVSTFDGVKPHVPTVVVQAAMRQARADAIDSVISFGGGSGADLGKAVCFFAEQEAGTPGVSFVDRPVLAHVAIPTTYAGAELAPYFGMTDEATGRTTGGGGPTTVPLAAIYDPALTLDTPPDVSARTGMSALAHGIEAAYSPERTPEAEAVARACIERVVDALPRVVKNPHDLEARADMLVGAVLGGRCLQNATMGVHHGLAQLVGGRTGMPRGLADGAILAHALRFNADEVPAEAAGIGRALGDEADPAGAVDRLRQDLGLPAQLSDCGLTDEHLDAVVRMSAGHPHVIANPRRVSEADVRSILEAAF